MADLDDLKKAWQSHDGISQEAFDRIGCKVRESTTLFQSTIFRRDLAESFASLVVLGFAVPGFLSAKNAMTRSGFAIVVLACVTIPVVLWWCRKKSISEVGSASFGDFIEIEIGFLRRQILLLRMVTWWYLLPLYVGLVLIVLGVTATYRRSPIEIGFVVVYLAFCTALMVYIWWINQFARAKHLEPLLQYYVELRKAVDSGDDSSLPSDGPPTAFLTAQPRPPMSRMRKCIWLLASMLVTTLVTASGIALIEYFDRRTGIFVLTTVPVVAFAMIFVSGVWRQTPSEDSVDSEGP